MFPWITDNPLTYHCTDYLTKEEIDMAVEGGFDMIIHSYNADGSSDEKQMLARDQKTLDKYKELVDYAHSRGIEVGMYQGHHKLNQYGSKYKPDGKPKDLTYGGNDGGKYGVFCMASAAFDDYWDNFRYFVEYTGLDCIEIDGAYGSWDCLNGEDHINEDKETDPDPNGVDKTTGDASKYRVHHGYFDSKVVQWENITRELCETFREMDTYIRVPSWWYAIGGNKNTIGYEEIAWSQPRQEQLIYGRQMIYNAGYARTMSMCWSHIPFSQYHGGGDSAAFLPFGEKIDDYNWVVAQNVGNGVTSDFRGKDLYDETVLPILTRWVNFFDRYRGIVNSDMVHISQARSEDNPLRTGKMDTLYHVNANNEGEKGLLWVYNQTDEERTEIITVPMYYTGLTELSYPSYPLPGSMGKNVKSYKGGSGGKYGWLPKVRDYTLPDVTGEITGQAAFLQEGSKLQVLDIDSNGNAQLSVTLAPMSFTYYTIYDPTEAPAVEMDIGAVTGLTGESQSSGVALTWNADASVSVKVNGVVDKDSTEIITGYRIYRDGELIGTALTNAFTDTSVLEELTTYTYTVKALVGVQEGAASDAAQVTTGADTTPPELLSVSSSGNKLVLTFSEVMAKAAAETLANYTLDQNVKVTGAALSADGKTVTLTVEGMESQKQYTLTVKNLTDNAKTPNPMADTEWTFINGYLAYYPMDGEELINSFSDSVANTQNVTYTASTGRDGCVYLNKKDKAYADLGYGWFSGSTDYSLALSVWPKDLSSARQAVLSSGQNGEPGDDFGIYLLAGKVVFTTSDASGEQVVELSSKKVLDADAWSRIMVTRSGDKFALYVNGELQEKVEKAGFPTYESKNAILLGAEVAYGGGDQTSYLWGRVDELVAYSNLQSLYDKYAEAEQGSYTDASWNALQDALAKAEKVLQDKDADQETVNEAYNLLQKAVNGLQQEGFEKVEGITNVGGFIDVKSTDWFAKAVQYAVDEGLMNGTSSNTFTPNGDTTRGMIVTILYRQAGSPRVKSDKATWWSDARVWAMECGVSDGTNMEKPITREQLATMLYRYAELNGKDVSKRTSLDSFKDGDKVSTYAVDALKWAVAEGIVTGKTGGFIDPQAGATRAETATMLMRFCEAFA